MTRGILLGLVAGYMFVFLNFLHLIDWRSWHAITHNLRLNFLASGAVLLYGGFLLAIPVGAILGLLVPRLVATRSRPAALLRCGGIGIVAGLVVGIVLSVVLSGGMLSSSNAVMHTHPSYVWSAFWLGMVGMCLVTIPYVGLWTVGYAVWCGRRGPHGTDAQR